MLRNPYAPIILTFATAVFLSPMSVNAQSSSHGGGGKDLSSQFSSLPQFASENEAQAHCPSDTVVWLNTRSGRWHVKGEKKYGTTKSGTYTCEKEAAAAGASAASH